MSKPKLLIADDHKLFSIGLKSVLQDSQLFDTIFYASNGIEAVDTIVKEKIEFVLMDINMPLLDGVEATRQVKAILPATKIIMVSMNGDYHSVMKALKVGADGYLIKNTDEQELIKAIKVVQQGEIYITTALTALFQKDSTQKLERKEDYIQFTENLISPREKQIVKLIADGLTNQAIATQLQLSVKTIDTHRKNMLAKLDLPNTAALVKFAFENKLI